MRIIRLFCCLIIWQPLLGCSYFAKSNEPTLEHIQRAQSVNKKVLADFEKGQKLLEEEKYAEASDVFEKILTKNPVNRFDLVVLFNSGSAYEGMGNCNKAGRRFRKVSRYALNKYPRIQAQSLLRLSYAYECLGRPSKAAVTLLDVYKRKKYLPPEVGNAEVPARLAAAYSQLGNEREAQKYFKIAEAGLVLIQAHGETAREKKELLARTLFLMGNIKLESIERMTAQKFMKSADRLQLYLLKAIEMDSEQWSPKASDKLRRMYSRSWDLVDARESESEAKVNLAEKVKRAELSFSAIKKLKASRFPGDMGAPRVINLVKVLDDYERKFQLYLAENVEANTRLTPEAQRLNSVKKNIKIKSKETILEKEAKAKSQLPEKSQGDPNL